MPSIWEVQAFLCSSLILNTEIGQSLKEEKVNTAAAALLIGVRRTGLGTLCRVERCGQCVSGIRLKLGWVSSMALGR